MANIKETRLMQLIHEVSGIIVKHPDLNKSDTIKKVVENYPGADFYDTERLHHITTMLLDYF